MAYEKLFQVNQLKGRIAISELLCYHVIHNTLFVLIYFHDFVDAIFRETLYFRDFDGRKWALNFAKSLSFIYYNQFL